MADAVKAPRGSPFVDENDRLRPAWHHYLSNVEQLVTGLETTFDGQLLLQLEARIAAMEEAVTDAEERFPKRNWRFFHTTQAPTNGNPNGPTCLVEHNLDTKRVLVRAQCRNGGDIWNNTFQNTNSGNSTLMNCLNDGSPGEGWALALYDDLVR